MTDAADGAIARPHRRHWYWRHHRVSVGTPVTDDRQAPTVICSCGWYSTWPSWPRRWADAAEHLDAVLAAWRARTVAQYEPRADGQYDPRRPHR